MLVNAIQKRYGFVFIVFWTFAPTAGRRPHNATVEKALGLIDAEMTTKTLKFGSGLSAKLSPMHKTAATTHLAQLSVAESPLQSDE